MSLDTSQINLNGASNFSRMTFEESFPSEITIIVFVLALFPEITSEEVSIR